MARRRGFVIIIVISFLSIIALSAWAIINIGCGEMAQTKIGSDLASAYYAALSGAELVYAQLKSSEGTTITWPVILSGTIGTGYGGSIVGSYTAKADKIVTNEIFGIVSEGTVNGRKATVTVKYYYDAQETYAAPLATGGDITLAGHNDPDNPKKHNFVNVEGPLECNGAVNEGENVNITGEVKDDQDIAPCSFWLHEEFDTKGLNAGKDPASKIIIPHDEEHDYITRAEAVAYETARPGALEFFDANNVYKTTAQDTERLDDKDAFFYYYTSYLDQNNTAGAGGTALHLQISPGETNYYAYKEGGWDFQPGSVPEGTPIIFVDGSVDVKHADVRWNGDDYNHTIVSTGNINFEQPRNQAGDTLTLISYGDTIIGGNDKGGQLWGNLVVYAGNQFIANYGGVTNGAIYAQNGMVIDTLDYKKKHDRYLNKYDGEWISPLGLPPGFHTTSIKFYVRNETTYKPMWQES